MRPVAAALGRELTSLGVVEKAMRTSRSMAAGRTELREEGGDVRRLFEAKMLEQRRFEATARLTSHSSQCALLQEREHTVSGRSLGRIHATNTPTPGKGAG